MILTKDYVLSQATQRGTTYSEINKSRMLNESVEYFEKAKEYDLFLSHSYKDKEFVLTLVDMFKNAGYHAYVDWIDDTQLNRDNVTPKTADILRNRMKQSKGLAFLTSTNITNSKWCPWELGYTDGLKRGRCCILPVLETRSNSFDGQEYLGLYPYLEYEQNMAGKYDFWVYEKNGNYVVLSSWLNGREPFKHEG